MVFISHVTIGFHSCRAHVKKGKAQFSLRYFTYINNIYSYPGKRWLDVKEPVEKMFST